MRIFPAENSNIRSNEQIRLNVNLSRMHRGLINQHHRRAQKPSPRISSSLCLLDSLQIIYCNRERKSNLKCQFPLAISMAVAPPISTRGSTQAIFPSDSPRCHSCRRHRLAWTRRESSFPIVGHVGRSPCWNSNSKDSSQIGDLYFPQRRPRPARVLRHEAERAIRNSW